MRDTFQTLRENKLRCNGRKCEFAMKSISYLGFQLSSDGITITDDKIKIIKALKPPKDKKSLMQVLGLLTFFRRFVKSYSKRTYNMRQLLRKETVFKWTEECQKEFEDLKNALIQAPVLSPIDPNKPYLIVVDAALQGLGYTILQRQLDGYFHPIAYGGQACTPAMKSWTAAQLEIAAIGAALRSMEPYFLQQKVTVLTDNCSCLYFHKLQFGTAREKRMAVYLSQFNLNIRYIKGAHNMAADCLSRSFDAMSEEEKNVFMPQTDTEDFIFKVYDPAFEQNALNSNRQVGSHYGEPQAKTLQVAAVRRRRARRASIGATGRAPSAPSAVAAPSAAAAPLTASASNKSSDQSLDSTRPRPESADAKATESQDAIPQAPELSDEEIAEADGVNITDLPLIQDTDYEVDVEFSPMWNYLMTGQLTNREDIDRRTLLICDQFFIENGKLYKLELPRNKKLQRVKPLTHRLCIPEKFRDSILQVYHDKLGHSGQRRFLLTMMTRVYWRSLYSDAQKYALICDTCQRVKTNYSKRTIPLHPLEAEILPFTAWSLDIKTLPRVTNQGTTGLLCIIDVFSKFPIVLPISDFSAETTAKAFVNNIICHYGIPQKIYTDSGSNFMSRFFKEITRILGIKHYISAVHQPRTNGLSERLIRQVSEGLKLYAVNDLCLEEVLPIVLMALRANAHSKLQLSPFEILYGRNMPLGRSLEDEEFIAQTKGDLNSYQQFLRKRLQDIHEGIHKNIVETKLEDKRDYDKRNKAIAPSWFVGQKVMLQTFRPDVKNNKILTYKPFTGPYIITGIFASDGCGEAYRLVDESTGKPLRRLITGDRLKIYHTDPQGTARATSPGQEVRNQPTKIRDNKKNKVMVEAKCILRQAGKNNYLVLFSDNTKSWTNHVSEGLLRDWRLRQDEERLRRRQRRNQSVNN